ncbi:unnamed protein product [Didymodactylos carnosus]|uniref:Cap-specific mRNA (nucleoside-2'-O-)-methyltransferase n=1 Tax=Didymodactylos carnosus TaxID=1234261 RepID=A0A8S2FHM5_9BILA|nr:unnamed protein product [Didymodactylos carnosus]CAF4263565.1 unnamed protein product [Didymodactylos carnosus]
MKLDKEFSVNTLALDRKQQDVYNRNPHLREIFINRKRFLVYTKDFVKEQRFLKLFPRGTDLRISPSRNVTTEHWGERKAMLTEIEFLTNYAKQGTFSVIYVGAAPGSHINFLSTLFPQLDFILIDTKEFVAKETEKIHICSENFTNELAKKYSRNGRDLLFICDVHTFGPHHDLDDYMVQDMYDQMVWYSTLKPQASLLRFRILRAETYEYLKGDLILEPWASRRNTECRLVVVKDAPKTDYNNRAIEAALAYFHDTTRTMFYEHDLNDSEAEGLDHCYDCRAEIFILHRYLSKIQNISNGKALIQKTAEMSFDISRNIQDKTRPPITNGIRTLNVIQKK